MEGKTPRTVSFVVDRQERRVLADSIIYAQVIDKLCTVYLTQEEPIQMFLTLSALKSQLPSGCFLQISRSCLVSLDHIQNVGDGRMRLSDGTVLPYSRRRKSAVLAAFQEHLSQRALSHTALSWKLDLAAEFRCFDRCPYPFFILEFSPEAGQAGISFPVRFANEALASLVRLPLPQLVHAPLRPEFQEQGALSRFTQTALYGGTAEWYVRYPFSQKLFHLSCYQPHYGFCACLLVPTEELP